MSADICPYCAKPAIFLEDVSRTANVDYFRCDSCWHIWSIEKSRAVSSEQPRSQPTPHPCPSCKSGFGRPHRVAIIASRPDIVVVGSLAMPAAISGRSRNQVRRWTFVRRTILKLSREEQHRPASSENAIVDDFRCNRCGHVWTLDKHGARRDVTIDVSTASGSHPVPPFWLPRCAPRGLTRFRPSACPDVQPGRKTIECGDDRHAARLPIVQVRLPSATRRRNRSRPRRHRCRHRYLRCLRPSWVEDRETKSVDGPSSDERSSTFA
jgi:hypothetical protein